MKKIFITTIFLMHLVGVLAQTNSDDLDPLYREDQFYFGFTYNTLTNTPEDFSQTGFSPGFKIGFIRDFPINTKRTFALGLGLGYAFNVYSENIKIKESLAGYSYEVVSRNTYQKNRFSHQALEIPFEFRWRTSSPQEYRFWRIYAGFKASYTFASSYVYEENTVSTQLKNFNLNQWQYGLTLSVGYNNWNGFLYYGLNPIFEDALVGQETLEAKSIKIGLMFYFL
jgi:hypothetical protein